MAFHDAAQEGEIPEMDGAAEADGRVDHGGV